MKAWNPAFLNPVAWWDASRLDTITSLSDRVPEWRDISGNGYHMRQPTGAYQPYTGLSTQNGRNVISTAVSGETWLTLNSPPPVVKTIAGLIQNGVSGFYELIILGANPTTTFEMAVRDTSGSPVVSFDGVVNTSRGRVKHNGVEFTGFSDNFDASEVPVTSDPSVYIGESLDDVTDMEDIVGRRGLGATDGGPENWVGEMLWFDGVLAADDISRLEGYLVWKWGAESALVAGHPYAEGRPLTDLYHFRSKGCGMSLSSGIGKGYA